jgi:hypothetical protein
MCIGAPKVPKTPPAAERQPMQVPKDMQDQGTARALRRRRGLWASIFTSAQGAAGVPLVTGSSGGLTGG